MINVFFSRAARFRSRAVLLAFLLLLIPCAVWAQNIRLDYQNTPLITVLGSIQNQSGYKFVYNNSLIDVNQRVTVQTSGERIETVLDKTLKGTGISWKIIDKQIALSPADNRTVLQQGGRQLTVRGRITDQDGEPLVGAAVQNLTDKTYAITDIDGNYVIEVKNPATAVMEISSLSMETVTEPLNGRARLDVQMNPDRVLLDEVVVTGYQTLSKERATGSFDIVGHAQLDKASSNIATRLVGAAPGIAYTTDIYGNPSFSIRGTSTFSDQSAPLIVVDGFAVSSSFTDINPNDVESVTILKDAAAASIWGARSANGVIVITTKNARRAAEGRATVTVDYSGFYKISPKLNLDYTLSRASSSDVIDYEVNNFHHWDAPLWYPEESDYSGGNSVVYDLLNEARLGHISQAEALSQIEAYRKLDNSEQLRKYFLQNASTFQQNLSINVSTARSQSVLSLLYEDQQKIYKRNQDKKYMVSFRNRTNLFKWLDLTVNGTYNYTSSNNSNTGLPALSPYEMLVDSKGDYIRYSGGISLNYLNRHVPTDSFPYADWTWNPVEDLYARELTSASSLARLQAGLTFKIIDGLTVDAKAQYEMIQGRTHNYYTEQTYLVRSTVNTAASWNQSTNQVTMNLPKGGFLDQSTSQRNVLTLRGQVNFNRTFAGRHAVAAIAGFETIDNVYQTFGHPRTYGYDDNSLSVGTFPNGVGGSGALTIRNWQGSAQTFGYTNSFSYLTDRYFSAFANASYTFDGKYTLSGSVRTDASNLITDDPKYRYAPFWSVGASWQLGKEEFIKNVSWLDLLTLRATFGYNGNVDKSTTFKPLINPSASPSTLTHEYTATMASYGNPALRWERTRTFDVGVDFAALGNKLHGKIDVYQKHSLDLIASVSLPAVQGTSSMSMNSGEIDNRGIELEIGSTIPINRNIVWDGALMFAWNRNRIASLNYYPSYAYQLVYSGGSYAWMEGYDMNTMWSYKYGGIENRGTETVPDWQPTLVGKDGVHQTFASWPSGDAMNISYDMGTTVAPVNVAFSTSLKLYDFDISLMLTGKFGHVFRRESFNYPGISGRSIPNAKYSEIIDCDPAERIHLPMKDNETRLYFWDRFWGYVDYLTENASFIRMQEIDVAYNLPKSATAWLGVNSLKLFVQASNPFSIYFNKWNEDPEFPRGSAPLQSAYMFGVKCNF